METEVVEGWALLVVDGDDILRRALRDQLIMAEPSAVVDEAGTGAAALEKARSRAYDLLLLDAALPDQTGWQTCSTLRQMGVRGPVIVMTTAGADVDLEAGATDYVVKPFRMSALLSRIHTLLRHQDQSDAAILIIGPYTFQPAAKMLSVSGNEQKIRLTEKETAILTYLHRLGNKTVSRETLLGEVWGYNAAVTTHTLETHVYRLRQKIEADPQQAQILLTEAGGYRLNL